MKFLANENFPGCVIQALQTHGFATAWVRTDNPGSPDTEVLARANFEKRILLTFDRDFGELAFHRGANVSCGIILFRLPKLSPDDLTNFIVSVLNSRHDWQDHFTVVEAGRIRMRQLPK